MDSHPSQIMSTGFLIKNSHATEIVSTEPPLVGGSVNLHGCFTGFIILFMNPRNGPLLFW